MKIDTEDQRTDQEKRQDAFEDLAKRGDAGTKAKIMFAGDAYEVKLKERTEKDGMNIVRFEILGNKHSMDGNYLVFNVNTIHTQDDSELIKII